jgi:MraZ protein
VVKHKITRAGETFKSLARATLGNAERWADIHKLNATFSADATLPVGTIVRLPGDACVSDDGEAVRALPNLRPRGPVRAKAALPLTGTYHVTLDDNRAMTLPKAVRDQLGNCDTVLVSPGSDKCLWLTNQAHLDRMAAKLDKSSARESDVRTFKRLYYAQTVKVPMKDGHVGVSEKLAQFAGLGQELVLVGIDDHFEVWDAARWRRYTQAKRGSADD